MLCIPAFSGENGPTDHFNKTHHLSTNGHGRVELHAEDLILKMSNSSCDAWLLTDKRQTEVLDE